MIIESKYRRTPIFGIITREGKKFNHCELFKDELWKYAVLKSIKVWWGTPIRNGTIGKEKTLLRIQCRYKNIMTGEVKDSNQYNSGSLSNDADYQEIVLEQNDYFNQFHIGFDTFISYIKFTTKDKKKIEFGQPNKDVKTIKLNNEKEPNMVQCFIGYYNDNKITALGCNYIRKKDYIFLHLMDIFRIRHIFKTNEQEKQKWLNSIVSTPDLYDIYIKALVKLCSLPDTQFYTIIKYFA
jgi:hypothetical protein